MKELASDLKLCDMLYYICSYLKNIVYFSCHVVFTICKEDWLYTSNGKYVSANICITIVIDYYCNISGDTLIS